MEDVCRAKMEKLLVLMTSIAKCSNDRSIYKLTRILVRSIILERFIEKDVSSLY